MRVTIDTDDLKITLMNIFMETYTSKDKYIPVDTLKGVCLLLNEIEKCGGK